MAGARAPLPIEPGTLVIGDLHLDPLGGAEAEAFAAWLGALRGCPRLIVLGDLFETWIGRKQLRLPGSAAVIAALRACVERGTALDVIPGNRDFLLGVDFERWTGGRVHAGGLVGEFAGGRLLVLHGDELCTKDVSFMRMKRVLHSRLARGVLPRLPFFVLRWLAGRLRAASQRAVPRKPSAEKAMQSDAARAAAAAAGADVLVVGHAHAFRDERLPGGLRWLVIDGWGGARDTLVLDPVPRPLSHAEAAS